jgi:hypothetical protein
MSTQWPDYICKGGCERTFPPDTDKTKCPDCFAPLIRWKAYEIAGQSPVSAVEKKAA